MSDINELETIELVNPTQEAKNIRLMFSIHDSIYNLKNKLSRLDSYINKYNLDKKDKQEPIIRRVV